MIDFREEPGWVGVFTRNQELGTWRNGTRVRKTNSEPGDATPNGTLGTVLGSISSPEVQDGAVMYFIEWDNRPKVAVGCMGFKLEYAE
jgi:hypothetical protein